MILSILVRRKMVHFGFLNVSYCPHHMSWNRIPRSSRHSKYNPLKNDVIFFFIQKFPIPPPPGQSTVLHDAVEFDDPEQSCDRKTRGSSLLFLSHSKMEEEESKTSLSMFFILVLSHRMSLSRLAYNKHDRLLLKKS